MSDTEKKDVAVLSKEEAAKELERPGPRNRSS